MRYTIRTSIFTAITTAALLAVAVSSAAAGHFRFSEQRFDAKWTSWELSVGTKTIRCPVTLEGSFHSATIAKAPDALIGHITRAAVTSTQCIGGSATVLAATLPWPILYEAFDGTLPRIEGLRVKLIRFSIQIQPAGSLVCLAESTTTSPGRYEILLSSGIAGSLAAEPLAEIPLRGGLGACSLGGDAHFTGATTSLTALASTARITITLI